MTTDLRMYGYMDEKRVRYTTPTKKRQDSGYGGENGQANGYANGIQEIGYANGNKDDGYTDDRNTEDGYDSEKRWP